MSVYAVCTRCLLATRLTKDLALKIAAMKGPPVSLCCNADVRVEERAE